MLLISTRKKRISYNNSSKEYYRCMCLYTIAISLNINLDKKAIQKLYICDRSCIYQHVISTRHRMTNTKTWVAIVWVVLTKLQIDVADCLHKLLISFPYDVCFCLDLYIKVCFVEASILILLYWPPRNVE